MGVGVQRHAPTALTTDKTRYRLYSRLGGPQGRSGQMRKISPPLGFNPRTVTNRYTDRAIPVKTNTVKPLVSRSPVTVGHTFMEPASYCDTLGHYTTTWSPVYLES
jgi:hypothetical protein